MSKKINIGITIDFNIKFHANGLQQNIIFLKKLLDGIENIYPKYIFVGELSKEDFIKPENCIHLDKFVSQEYIKFDLIILVGFWFKQKIINDIKENNKEIKFILLQCGNQFIENSMRSVHHYEKVSHLNDRLEGIDGLWTLPQHSQNITYMKTYYGINNVREVPCIWDSLFIDKQIKELGLEKEKILSTGKGIKNIIILEPNLSIIKSCLLPIFIVETFENKFPKILESCNLISGKKIIENHYFIRLILKLNIFQKRKNFLKATPRYKFTEAVRFFGKLVISHQIENDLNYLYFDALYLNLPLVHNSVRLRDYGYFYPQHNIEIAVSKIDFILENHERNLPAYELNCKKVLNEYSVSNESNKQNYLCAINEVLSK